MFASPAVPAQTTSYIRVSDNPRTGLAIVAVFQPMLVVILASGMTTSPSTTPVGLSYGSPLEQICTWRCSLALTCREP